MGEVWRAEHQLLARRAAIKLVRSDIASDEAHAALIHERFRREAQTLASMKSRHTIELYDYGVTDDGTFFYVMELLDGFDLSQLVKTWGPLPAARVISIMAQACGSLGEAHDAGLLHRDVKPANLVLCRAADEVDIVKVLDFGIVHRVNELGPPAAQSDGKRRRLATAPVTKRRANGADAPTATTKPTKTPAADARATVTEKPPSEAKLSVTARAPTGGADAPTAVGIKPTNRPPEMPGEPGSDGNRLTVDGSVIGTPGYIAPEQAISAPLDPRGDIYSLGCVAWFLLTGGEVYTGRNSVEDILLAHVDAPIPMLRPLVSGWLPVELEAVIVRCLGKEPSDRPDARELARVLREIEIPDEHAWTRADAAEWWAEPRVIKPSTPRSEEATAVGALVVAHQAPPMIADAESEAPRSEAQTLVARPSNPNLE
jgi:serine/threonine protein kinase